ncbi:MAG: 50S ribosomal protein L13 [Candidatus Paceibacterota bacterium]
MQKEHIIDAKNKKLGRVASEIAILLQGKHDPSYDPRLASNNKVIVKNIKDIKVSGNKYDEKIYYRHSTRVGSLKKKKFSKIFEEDPSWVLKHAVRLMLPKNKLSKTRLKNLKIEESEK